MVKEAQLWSVCIGDWKGVPIYLHSSIFLVAILLIGCQLGALPGFAEATSLPTGSNLGSVALTIVAATVILLIPTIVQLIILHRPHQSVQRIFLMPNGASFEWHVDTTPPERLQAQVVGMLASFALFFCALLAFASLENLDFKRFWLQVSVLHPQFVDAANFIPSVLASCLWFSAVSMYLRAIPIAPFDFGRILHEWGQIRFPYLQPIQRAAMLFLASVFYVVLLIGMSYIWVTESATFGVWPLLVGTSLLFLARREYLSELQLIYAQPVHRDELAGIEYSGFEDELQAMDESVTRPVVSEENFDFADLSDVTPSASSWDASDSSDSGIESWMDENRESREQAREAQSVAEIALLDELLLKVSAGGIGCLSEQEREILERVSQIYRSRRKIRH
ncbi:MAG: hypothetical protein JNL67_17425 [Planctomycetaceae bacterium]|nr:hypothetical protein [Planctomycetaceae bacterium]